MKRVTIYTDGACSGNPGPGGWGAVLIFEGKRKEIGGGEALTTNNRMELMAAIQALNTLKYSCEVELFSDSSYLIDAHLKGWLFNWQSKDFVRGKNKEPIPNRDLWISLLEAENKHIVHWHKVNGHSGIAENEVCDKIATRYAALQRKATHDSGADSEEI